MSPSAPSYSASRNTNISSEAAGWIIKRDRGFTADEERGFAQWLRADPRHAIAIKRSDNAWGALAQIPPDVARSTTIPRPRYSFQPWYAAACGLAAAAGVVLAYLAWQQPSAQIQPLTSAPSEVVASQSRVLSDGTVAQLNTGSELVEHFTAAERNVELKHGEAYFTVTKNADRPFIVHAGNARLRAVGTAFNVDLKDTEVEVLVTEGKVWVSSSSDPRNEPPSSSTPENALPQNSSTQEAMPSTSHPILVAGQRAVVKLVASLPAIEVFDVNSEEWTKTMAWAWQRPLMRLAGATLAELAEEFQRRTGKQLVFVDPAVANLRVGGRFPGDDAVSFVHVLEENYGLKSELTPDGTILLRKSP